MTVPCLNGVGSCEYEIPHDREHGRHTLPQLPREPALLLPPACRGDAPGGGGDPRAGYGAHPGGCDGGRVPGYSDLLRREQQGQNSGLCRVYICFETVWALVLPGVSIHINLKYTYSLFND